MKNVRKLLAVLMTCAMVLGTIPVLLSAEATPLTFTADFSMLASATKDQATSSYLGVYEASNLQVNGNHGNVITPGGYQGEGYIVVKLDAGSEKKFGSVTLNLDYWAYNADGGPGYVKILTSSDGTNYSEFLNITASADKSTLQNLTTQLSGAIGNNAVYVKVVMQHWESWEGAAVKKISLTGTTSDVVFTADFSKLASATKDEATSAYLGVYQADNLQVNGNHGNVITPGGYQGEGYIVAKLDAGAGKKFVSASLNLDYWAYNAGGGAGYVKIFTSPDGTNYTELTNITASADKSSLQNLNQALTVTTDQNTIFVKVAMQHWESWEGAAVKTIALTGNIIGVSAEPTTAPTEIPTVAPTATTTPSSTPTVAPTEAVTGTKVSLTKSFSLLSFGEVSASDIGAYAEENMYYGIDGVALLSSRNGYEAAYAVWKLDAAAGETFHDFTFKMIGRTWYQDAAQKNNNSLKVSVSTNGIDYTLVKEYKSNDNASDTQELINDLSQYVQGASTVYVRLDFLVFDSPHIIGIRSVSLIGNANTASTVDVDNNPSTGSSWPIPAMICLVISGAAIIIIKRRSVYKMQ